MIDRDGRLLWKDELPFVIVISPPSRPSHHLLAAFAALR